MAAIDQSAYVSDCEVWLFNTHNPASWATSGATSLGICGSAKMVSIVNDIEVGSAWQDSSAWGNSRFLGSKATAEAIFLERKKALKDFLSLFRGGAANYYGEDATTVIKAGQRIPETLKRPILFKALEADHPSLLLLRPIALSSGVIQWTGDSTVKHLEAQMVSILAEWEPTLGASFFEGEISEFPTNG